MKEKKVIKLTGNLIHFGKKNLNGRIYTEELAEEIVEKFNKQEETMFGEMGYPEEGSLISLGNVSHEVEEIHIDKDANSIAGTIKILDTPKGKVVKTILEEIEKGSPTGLSCRPRGMGNVDASGNITDFELISFDLIADMDAFANIKKDDYIKPMDDE